MFFIPQENISSDIRNSGIPFTENFSVFTEKKMSGTGKKIPQSVQLPISLPPGSSK